MFLLYYHVLRLKVFIWMLLTAVVKFVVDVDVFANANSYIIFVFLSFFASKGTRYILKNLIVNLGQCESLVVRRIKDI